MKKIVMLALVLLICSLTVSCAPTLPYYVGQAQVVDFQFTEHDGRAGGWQLIVLVNNKAERVQITDTEYYTAVYKIGEMVPVYCKSPQMYCDVGK